MTFEPGSRVHIVGVGGSGMSGVARLLHERGCLVSGSDAANSPSLEALAALGMAVHVGHDGSYGRDADVVLWSPAVPEDHVELTAARVRGVTMIPRARLLALLGRMQPVLGITGTHGKTTATSMLAHVATAAGRDPSWLLGAEVRGLGPNGHWGSGPLVLEVDESYGTLGELEPAALGLLNVQADHLDYYQTLGAVEDAFNHLVRRTRGPVVVWIDDPGAQRATRTRADVITVGSASGAWRVADEVVDRQGSRFSLVSEDQIVPVRLRVTGHHTVADASVVAVLALMVGMAIDAVVTGLEAFAGAPRRFELRGTWRTSDVFDDYAHLPAEIEATLAAARASGYRRIVAIFQPHRVTRTSVLAATFAGAFDDADEVIVTDLYSAGEPNPTGITGEVVARAVLSDADSPPCHYAATFADVLTVLERLAPPDAVVILGAGDITQLAAQLVGEAT